MLMPVAETGGNSLDAPSELDIYHIFKPYGSQESSEKDADWKRYLHDDQVDKTVSESSVNSTEEQNLKVSHPEIPSFSNKLEMVSLVSVDDCSSGSITFLPSTLSPERHNDISCLLEHVIKPRPHNTPRLIYNDNGNIPQEIDLQSGHEKTMRIMAWRPCRSRTHLHY
ncbi:hypothetical protein HELRODRAFT_189880 [Helobdella robusta]|uniref:Uncharacterized protein n=1 Tax=Helobdella robusta TaxID=6412 RepID=T1FRG2_HELRO|nr:hypothetical protein HELRODRAFT_189880 [Helobdella robusta]ESN90520.1 hypothetical protein HELRODRAFT_189880 [Helobdella robusta]